METYGSVVNFHLDQWHGVKQKICMEMSVWVQEMRKTEAPASTVKYYKGLQTSTILWVWGFKANFF